MKYPYGRYGKYALSAQDSNVVLVPGYRETAHTAHFPCGRQDNSTFAGMVPASEWDRKVAQECIESGAWNDAPQWLRDWAA